MTPCRTVGEKVDDGDVAIAQHRSDQGRPSTRASISLAAEHYRRRDRRQGDQVRDSAGQIGWRVAPKRCAEPSVADSGIRGHPFDPSPSEIGSVRIVRLRSDVDDQRDTYIGELSLDGVERPAAVSNGPDRGGQALPPFSSAKAGQMSW